MMIVDGHEDIAWNMLSFGRDYTRSVAQIRADEAGTPIPERVGQAMLGWPDWIEGNVGLAFATLYACPTRHRTEGRGTQYYDSIEEATHLYQAQLDLYDQLVARHADKFYLITCQADLVTGLAEWKNRPPQQRRLGLVLLMEGAEGVRDPGDLPDWFERGLRIVGLTWASTQYGGGSNEPGPLTDRGRELLTVMARLGMILDISHLADEAVDEALERYPGPVIASHSNVRALLPDNFPERHLRDQTIRRLAARRGVMGVVLPNDFVKNGVQLIDSRHLVRLDDVIDHIDYMCQLVGNARHVGLGSDLDGGFGLEQTPTGLDSVAHLAVLGEALARRGYTMADIELILGGNWLNLLRWALPE
jgi:membrane dipeptidase